jgi:FMN phosphatase YigB (HAD superfamily)
MASLEDAVASWLVSGDVGSMLPEPALFEATRRTLSVDLYDVLYLSSVPEDLDAAAELGMATAYFAAGPTDVVETPHTLVRGFEDLLRGSGS